MMFKLLLLIVPVLSLLSACYTDKTKHTKRDNQKNIELLWSHIFWDPEYAYEEDLSYRYMIDSNSFYNQPNVYIDSVQWDLLMREMDNLVLDSIETNKPYLQQHHNYCVNFQMNFRLSDSVLCRICIDIKNNRIKKENKIYYATNMIKEFLNNSTVSDSLDDSVGKYFSRRLILVQ